jgi:hypothetical protein
MHSREKQECNGHKQQKLVQMEDMHTTSVKATSLGKANLLIKQLSSPWFHQEANALMGLIRLIYLFLYLFIAKLI